MPTLATISNLVFITFSYGFIKVLQWKPFHFNFVSFILESRYNKPLLLEFNEHNYSYYKVFIMKHYSITQDSKILGHPRWCYNSFYPFSIIVLLMLMRCQVAKTYFYVLSHIIVSSITFQKRVLTGLFILLVPNSFFCS